MSILSLKNKMFVPSPQFVLLVSLIGLSLSPQNKASNFAEFIININFVVASTKSGYTSITNTSTDKKTTSNINIPTPMKFAQDRPGKGTSIQHHGTSSIANRRKLTIARDYGNVTKPVFKNIPFTDHRNKVCRTPAGDVNSSKALSNLLITVPNKPARPSYNSSANNSPSRNKTALITSPNARQNSACTKAHYHPLTKKGDREKDMYEKFKEKMQKMEEKRDNNRMTSQSRECFDTQRQKVDWKTSFRKAHNERCHITGERMDMAKMCKILKKHLTRHNHPYEELKDVLMALATRAGQHLMMYMVLDYVKPRTVSDADRDLLLDQIRASAMGNDMEGVVRNVQDKMDELQMKEDWRVYTFNYTV